MKDKKSLSPTAIHKETGLSVPEISMALNAKRLLSRAKLKKLVDAGYDLHVFVFGKDSK